MQKYANLVELEKCCQTHIFLQNFVLIQPRTSPPKICKMLLIFPIRRRKFSHPRTSRPSRISWGRFAASRPRGEAVRERCCFCSESWLSSAKRSASRSRFRRMFSSFRVSCVSLRSRALADFAVSVSTYRFQLASRRSATWVRRRMNY